VLLGFVKSIVALLVHRISDGVYLPSEFHHIDIQGLGYRLCQKIPLSVS